tara:strand:- start:521 stop:796 length:276 start_codon:yes stop_codon:yes gene_type:complete
MKVMVWVTQTNVELLERGEIIQYWLREPANALDVVQIQISYDNFIRLRDNQPEHYVTRDHMRFINYSGMQDDNYYTSDTPKSYDEGYGVED